MTLDPLYGSIFNSSGSPSSSLIDDRGGATTQRTLFKDESLKSLLETGLETINHASEDHDLPGGAIIKCLDEMKRLTDECQRRSIACFCPLSSLSLSISVSLSVSVSVS
jgi:hypothetical protein